MDWKSTSNNAYEVGVDYKITGNFETNAECTVEIIPYLRRNGDYERKQHKWNVYFMCDDMHVHTYNYTGSSGANALPNDYAVAGVESSGQLYMKKNVAYQWGKSYTVKLKTDGALHKIGVRMECYTEPRYCPSKNTSEYVTTTVQVAKQKVVAPKPTGVAATFNEDTRVLTYTWDDAACDYILLWRNWLDENGNTIKQGYIAPSGQNNKVYNKDKPITETLADNVAKVTYEMVNVSSTDDRATTGELSIDIPTGDKVYVNVPEIGWKKAIPYVKVGNEWKKATKTYVKVGNDWKRTIV